MWQSLLAISCGAVLGAVARWLLGLGLNPLFASLNLGTLAANLISSFLIGIFIAFCGQFPTLNETWKLFVVTGFLGSFSTMSSLSAEVVTHLLDGKLWLGFSLLSLHIAGCLLATFVGIWLGREVL